MAGHGKLCFGYCNDPTLYLDRVRRMTEITDRDGHHGRCERTHR